MIEIALNHKHPDVRIAAAEFVSRMNGKHSSLIPLLLNGLYDEKIKMQKNSIAALEQMEHYDPSLIPILLEKLNHKELIFNVIEFLGAMGEKASDAVPTLLSLQLEDRFYKVRLVKALKKITGKDFKKEILGEDKDDFDDWDW